MVAALDNLVELLDRLQAPWVLIGALAANRFRDSARMTQDIDLLVDLAHIQRSEFDDALRRSGWTVIRADPAGELVRIRHHTHGLADILVAGTEYQREAIARAVHEGRNRLLTIEDVIIHKLIAGRYQDDADVESILATKPALDRTYLDRWIDYWDVGDRWQRLSAAE